MNEIIEHKYLYFSSPCQVYTHDQMTGPGVEEGNVVPRQSQCMYTYGRVCIYIYVNICMYVLIHLFYISDAQF